MRSVLMLLLCNAVYLMGTLVAAQGPLALQEPLPLQEPAALTDQWRMEQLNTGASVIDRVDIFTPGKQEIN